MSIPATRSVTRSANTSMHSNVKGSNPPQAQDDQIVLTWHFFNPPRWTAPRLIKIPRQLFNQESPMCHSLFIEHLADVKFLAEPEMISLWIPKTPILIEDFHDVIWPATVAGLKGAFGMVLPAKALANVVPGTPDPNLLHLVVSCQGSYKSSQKLGTEEEESRDTVPGLRENLRVLSQLSRKGPSPSHGSKSTEYMKAQGIPEQVIYDGRWAKSTVSTIAPPIQLFHPVFESFVRDTQDPHLQLSLEDFRYAQELMHSMSKLTNEATRASELRTKLSEVLGHTMREERNSDTSCADGIIAIAFRGVTYPFSIMELKQEAGEGGSDPSTQAAITMRRTWTQADRTAFAKKFCCPTLILSCVGPWLAVLGGVFTDMFIVQRLTDLMWIGHSSTHEELRVHRLTRVLVALRNGLNQLGHYYKTISTANIPVFNVLHPHPRNYPYPTSFIDSTSDKVLHFKYLCTLEEDARCVTYKAKILDSVDSLDIVVKFAATYGKGVHELLSGHAPFLRYCGPPLDDDVNSILGRSFQPFPEPSQLEAGSIALPLCPMLMIVMDHIEPNPWPSDAFQQIQDVLTDLHGQGFVFGDLRPPNILFDMDDKVKFIDFDWSGPYDKTADDTAATLSPTGSKYAHYPLGLSGSITWPDGAGEYLAIRPEHDMAMLEKMQTEVVLRSESG